MPPSMISRHLARRSNQATCQRSRNRQASAASPLATGDRSGRLCPARRDAALDVRSDRAGGAGCRDRLASMAAPAHLVDDVSFCIPGMGSVVLVDLQPTTHRGSGPARTFGDLLSSSEPVSEGSVEAAMTSRGWSVARRLALAAILTALISALPLVAEAVCCVSRGRPRLPGDERQRVSTRPLSP